MVRFFLFVSFLGFVTANPFYIDVEPKKELTHQDYLEIQSKLRKIKLEPLIKKMHQMIEVDQDPSKYNEKDILGRSSRGIKQEMINLEKGFYPSSELIKIGKGSKNCIVCFSSFNKKYYEMIKDIHSALENTGFDGYFYFRIGGFPNPTGNEIRFAAIPYGFKIFMMLEAHLLGFENVIWIDSACLPLRNPQPLFDWIDQFGAFGITNPPNEQRQYRILPQTRECLIEYTQVDVLEVPHVIGGVFGLKMTLEKVGNFLKKYEELNEIGWPFISSFPEEFVITALFAYFDMINWDPLKTPKCLRGKIPNLTIEESIEETREQNYYFFLRPH